MRFGSREVANVVFKALAAQKIGSRQFYKNEPVLYFDTLKTSGFEGASSTVYAQGGQGNPRLIAWEGDKTLTFTMEDALISAEGLAILSGADLITPTGSTPIYVHKTSIVEVKTADTIVLPGVKVAWNAGRASEPPVSPTYDYNAEADIFCMITNENGETDVEPCVPHTVTYAAGTGTTIKCYANGLYGGVEAFSASSTYVIGDKVSNSNKLYKCIVAVTTPGTWNASNWELIQDTYDPELKVGDYVLVDYYVKETAGVQQIEITANQFAGYFYIEADTLFRREVDGVDLPAEFIIPKGKVQTNFNFSLSSSGDPSTFTFTVDAFPAYTKFDRTKKVLATIQIVDEAITAGEEEYRAECDA